MVGGDGGQSGRDSDDDDDDSEDNFGEVDGRPRYMADNNHRGGTSGREVWIAEVNCWGSWATGSARLAAVRLGAEDPGEIKCLDAGAGGDCLGVPTRSGSGSEPRIMSLDLALVAQRMAIAAHLSAAAERNAQRGAHKQVRGMKCRQKCEV